MRALIWFRNDLRLDDNPVVAAAARADNCAGVYCVDGASHAEPSRYGPPRLGPHRRGFLRECLADLRERMAAAGSALWVIDGAPEVTIPEICRAAAIDVVHVGGEPGPDEIAARKRVESSLPAGVRLCEVENRSLYRLGDLPFQLSAMPRAFTPFRKAIEAKAFDPADRVVAAPRTLPPSPALSTALTDAMPSSEQWPATATPYTGGETAVRARLTDYIWVQSAIADYARTRNQLLGTDFSSKFSPWLARGCLSPRRALAEIRAYACKFGADGSTHGLAIELLWRDFFHWTLWRHGSKLFGLGGLLARTDRPAAREPQTVAAWQRGRTGNDFIDANMIELACTGYMSNRGRQNAASFFARDLGQDWRLGAAWFEAMLVDYDVASNWGNWANVAGVGTDKRDRGFDVAAQAERYDPDGAFVRYWLTADRRT